MKKTLEVVVDKVVAYLGAVVLTIMAFFAVPAAKSEATIAELFAAVDVSGISTNVQTLLISFIGIALLFVGYRFIRKTLGGR